MQYMLCAQNVALDSNCLRRKVGAVIVKGDTVIAIGCNHQPRGCQTCKNLGCIRIDMVIPSGEQQQICRAVHAEQAALLFALKHGISVTGSVMYVTHQPCVICAKLLIEAGIYRIFYNYEYEDKLSLQMLKEAGMEMIYCGK